MIGHDDLDFRVLCYELVQESCVVVVIIRENQVL